MGRKEVYQSLVEVFPQVDRRFLWVVTRDQSKDADKAVEVVLAEESLPLISGRSSRSSRLVTASPPPLVDSSPSGLLDGEAEHEEEPVSMLRRRRVPSEETSGSSSEPRTDLASFIHSADSTTGLEEGLNLPIVLSCDASVQTNQLEGNGEMEHEENTEDCATNEVIPTALIQSKNTEDSDTNEVIPNALIQSENTDDSANDARSHKISHEQGISEGMPSSLILENDVLNLSFTSYHSDWEDFDGPYFHDFDMITSVKNPAVETSLKVRNYVVEQTPETHGGDLPTEFASSFRNDYENLWSMLRNIDDMIEAAKEDLKFLLQAKESLEERMKETELEERAAEQAKEALSRAGLDILAKAQELEQMMPHANEANDMFAGEVYGEKAILETEIKELQARLLSFSDNRDKMRFVLNEKRQVVEKRFAAANELRKAAEQEKQEKEGSAQIGVAEREKMEKLVGKSKNLQQCADENSKLRESVMDRGRVTDTLQGENSIICQDVKVLNEKFFVDRVPLNESIFSSQSTCILAPLGSSLTSTTSNVASALGETPESSKQRNPPTCSVDRQPKSSHSNESGMANKESGMANKESGMANKQSFKGKRYGQKRYILEKKLHQQKISSK